MIDIEEQLKNAALDLPADAPDFIARAEEEGLVDVAYASVDSPLGPLVVAATPKGLVRVSYSEFRGEDAVLEELARRGQVKREVAQQAIERYGLLDVAQASPAEEADATPVSG
jgi:hypothetical protein